MEDLESVARVVQTYLKSSGRNVAYINYSTRIQDYLEWYIGKTRWHTYQTFNGARNIDVERASLCMAKTVCEDMASLELNEKCDIKVAEETSQEYLDKVLEDNNFREQSNQLMEITNALGTGAFVVGVDDVGNTKISYIHGDMIFPLKWDNGLVTECAFVKIGGTSVDTKYTLIMHILEDGEYVIKTVELTAKGTVVNPTILGKKISEADDGTKYYTRSKIPYFQIIKPNIVNNYDKTNPLGMSIFGNAIDVLKSIDIIYDSWYNEFVLGKKRIFVKSGLKRVALDMGGAVRDQIDPSDTLFYQLEFEDKPPIYESNLTLRVAEHVEAMDKQLNLLARKVGLGDNFYAFNNGAVGRTATEVISTNSTLFRNLKKQELAIGRAVKGLVKAILQIGGYNAEQDITIDFDDSIIEDSDKEKQQALTEYNAGLIDQVEYFRLTRSMTREQAVKFVAKMQATDTMKEVNNIMGGFGFEQ